MDLPIVDGSDAAMVWREALRRGFTTNGSEWNSRMEMVVRGVFLLATFFINHFVVGG